MDVLINNESIERIAEIDAMMAEQQKRKLKLKTALDRSNQLTTHIV